MRILLIFLVFLAGCTSNKLLMPDSFDLHATHDMHQITGGFFGFAWDIEDDLKNE